MIEPSAWRRNGRLRAACALALLAGACGDAERPASSEPSPVGSLEMNGYSVPARSSADPTLPDSCTFLTESDPRAILQRPLGPILRMSDLCIAHDRSTPTLEHSLQVELRRPVSFELERGLPTDRDRYWEAEGGSVEMMGGTREGIEELSGLGDYAVWYPIGDGFMLHAYWQGRYILRLTMRGVERDAASAWARKVAERAIAGTRR